MTAPAVAPRNSDGAITPPLPPLPSVTQVATTLIPHKNASRIRIFPMSTPWAV